jgi:hypothetical protein
MLNLLILTTVNRLCLFGGAGGVALGPEVVVGKRWGDAGR